MPCQDWAVSYGIHPPRELLYNMPSFDDRWGKIGLNVQILVPLEGNQKQVDGWFFTRG